MEKIFERIQKSNDIHIEKWMETNLMFYTNALAGEVGELCNTTKHSYGGGTNPSKIGLSPEYYQKEMLAELADVMNYIAIITMRMGLTLDDLLKAQNKKLDEVFERRNK